MDAVADAAEAVAADVGVGNRLFSYGTLRWARVGTATSVATSIATSALKN